MSKVDKFLEESGYTTRTSKHWPECVYNEEKIDFVPIKVMLEDFARFLAKSRSDQSEH